MDEHAASSLYDSQLSDSSDDPLAQGNSRHRHSSSDVDGYPGMPKPRELLGSSEEESKAHREAAIIKLASVVQQHKEESEANNALKPQRRNSRCSTLPRSFTYNEAEATAAASTVAGCEKTVNAEEKMSCIIFDWDDTLFPTWYVMNVVKPCSTKDDPVPQMFQETLASFALVVRDLLQRARRAASVAIVTLAQRPWVEYSAHTYLPGLNITELLSELKIKVHYARECVRKEQIRTEEGGVNMLVVAKRNAMVKCLSRLKRRHGSEASNILAIGDSIVEHDAIKEVVWARDGHNLCKSVLLMGHPPLDILSNELKLLHSSVENMLAFQDDFDFNMETGTDHIKTWL
jgi:hypothetical protein